MTNRRIELLNKLIGTATGEDESKLLNLTILATYCAVIIKL